MTHASRSANQLRTEDFPASATEGEIETPGADDPQEPAGEVASSDGGVGDAASVPANASQPAPGSSEELPVAREGLPVPDVEETDTRS